MHTRSVLLRSACASMAAALTLSLALGVSPAWAQGQKVLKFIPQADLRILDPITTTAYITRNHGYMIYDTLFATDAKFQVQPQMVDKYDLSKDQLTYTFTLKLKRPFPLALEALAKPSSNVPFIMPERIAKTDA